MQLGSIQGLSVLELGPLEGGHTYMLEQMGVASITAIESNTRAFLKCLIAKEIFSLQRSHFLCGDFIEYLRGNQQHFDLGIASGVLYHMRNPAELVWLLSQVTDKLLVWTHYYDEKAIRTQNQNNVTPRFSSPGVSKSEHGFDHILYRYDYLHTLGWAGFCGGSEEYSCWMTRDDILKCFTFFGFKNIQTSFEHSDHPNGPAFAFLATK